VILAEVPKQRRSSAAAIFGHKGGPAALGQQCTSFFFLLWVRIFIDLGVASIAASSPSGLVPGGGNGGRTGVSSFIGVV
jgi:hypothetical protein